MQSEERELIVGLFNRLQPFESQPRDPEAERLIAQLVQRQPAAPYLLAQTAIVQEQALKAAQDRIAELERQAPAKQDSGFLGSAPRIGPWGSRAAEPAARMIPQAGGQMVPQAAAPMGQQLGGGGGFLRTALMTAAGVAGGALLFEGIRGLLGSGSGPLAAHAAQPLTSPDKPASDLLPPDQLSSADMAGDEGSADDYGLASDDSSFGDGGGFDEL